MSGLAGRLILVVEDEPLFALDIPQNFERAGARVITTRARSDAIAKSEGVSAAILDFGVGDGDGESLYAELIARHSVRYLQWLFATARAGRSVHYEADRHEGAAPGD